eukprot:m.75411 g.75411  ORF g.75411 m.75411 type:complete len:100 (+) comp8992_c0_seq1:498-797(+)
MWEVDTPTTSYSTYFGGSILAVRLLSGLDGMEREGDVALTPRPAAVDGADGTDELIATLPDGRRCAGSSVGGGRAMRAGADAVEEMDEVRSRSPPSMCP